MLIRIDNKIKLQVRSDFLSPVADSSQEINGLRHPFLYKAKIRPGMGWQAKPALYKSKKLTL